MRQLRTSDLIKTKSGCISLLLLLAATLFPGTSEGNRVLIRYDNLDDYYKYLHNEVVSSNALRNFLAIRTEPPLTQNFKAEICASVADSLFFKRRYESHFIPISDHNFYELTKYYGKFSNVYVKGILSDQKNIYPCKKRKNVKNVYPNALKYIQIGDKITREFVFSCMIRYHRSSILGQLFISSISYKGRFFVFKRTRNQVLKLLALVEEDTQLRNRFRYSDLKIEQITEAESSLCDMKDNDKLRLCNLVINSQSEIFQKYVFWPQKLNLQAECQPLEISEISNPQFKRFSLLRVIGCRVLNVVTNKRAIVSVSTVLHTEDYLESFYIYEKSGVKIQPFKHITGLRLTERETDEGGIKHNRFNCLKNVKWFVGNL